MFDFYCELLGRINLEKDDYIWLKEKGRDVISKYQRELEEQCEVYIESSYDFDSVSKALDDLAEKCGISPYTMYFIFLAGNAERALEKYRERGDDDSIFWETAGDFRCKIYECKLVKKVLGTFVPEWYKVIYSGVMVKLGRLEFAYAPYRFNVPYNKCGVSIKNGDYVANVHIPSDGPLTKELRYDSYRRAYKYYEKVLDGKPLVLACRSWLLYDKNKEIFDPGSNMADFPNDWDIVASRESPKFGCAWRLFGCDYNDNPDEMPQDTSAQRAMVRWFKMGRRSGGGTGIIVFDGEKIINK